MLLSACIETQLCWSGVIIEQDKNQQHLTLLTSKSLPDWEGKKTSEI